jgi:hypothetical protein
MSEQKKVRKITLGLIFGWIFGVIFSISSLATFPTDILVGGLYLIAALLALPPVGKLLKDKANISLSGGVKFVLIVILLIIIGTQMASGIGARIDSTYYNAKPPSGAKTTTPLVTKTSKTATPIVAESPKEYVEIFTFAGNGHKKSEPFVVKGSRFKIEYDCSGTLCQAFIYNTANSMPQLVMNTADPIKDETIIYDSGEYYIEANTIGTWSMTVYDYK